MSYESLKSVSTATGACELATPQTSRQAMATASQTFSKLTLQQLTDINEHPHFRGFT